MADDDKPTGEHTDPVTHQEAPEWAQRLQQTLEELPSRLKATVTDDDKNGIAEAVHGLFDKSGAFLPPARQDPKEEEEEEGDGKPDKPDGERKSWAARNFGG